MGFSEAGAFELRPECCGGVSPAEMGEMDFQAREAKGLEVRMCLTCDDQT